MTPTGWVRVELMGETRTVRADSFGEAAAKVDVTKGRILMFEWVPDPKTWTEDA